MCYLTNYKYGVSYTIRNRCYIYVIDCSLTLVSSRLYSILALKLLKPLFRRSNLIMLPVIKGRQRGNRLND